MPYPLDDNGNIRVDFVWGNMAMQPDEQRGDNYDDNEYTVEGGWVTKELVGNEALQTGWDQIVRRNGDQSDDGNVRYDIVEYGVHDIIDTGYSNYPAFIENYAGDGDTGLEAVVPDLKTFAVSAMDDAVVAAGLVYASATTHLGATTSNNGKLKAQSPLAGIKANVGSTVTATFFNAPEVPNVVGLTESAANTALIAANVVKGAVTTANNAAGATAINDGLVKTQTPAAGTTVNTGDSVALVKYAYTPVGPNYNIAGIRPAPGIGDTGRYLYLTGGLATHGINAQDLITLQNTGVENYNRQFTVFEIYPNDSFNTGGTRVTITNPSMDGTGGDVTNVGTYTKP
jgi:hypothetical protein